MGDVLAVVARVLRLALPFLDDHQGGQFSDSPGLLHVLEEFAVSEQHAEVALLLLGLLFDEDVYVAARVVAKVVEEQDNSSRVVVYDLVPLFVVLGHKHLDIFFR